MALSQTHDTQPIAIAVLGPTGTGKSSFIGAITNADGPVVGHGLRTCTATVQAVQTTVDGRPCVLIDTPGYDSTLRSDAEVLRETATFLEATLRAGCMLTGVIYLQRITDNRLGAAAARRVQMFEALCGLHAMPNVVLCSTMWDMLDDQSVGEARERELCATCWTPMLDAGARVRRLDGSREFALTAVRALLSRAPVVLRLQDELIRQSLRLSETAAGREVGQEGARAMEAPTEQEIERLLQQWSGVQVPESESIRGITTVGRVRRRALRAPENDTRRSLEWWNDGLPVPVEDMRRRVANWDNPHDLQDVFMNTAAIIVPMVQALSRLDASGPGTGRQAR